MKTQDLEKENIKVVVQKIKSLENSIFRIKCGKVLKYVPHVPFLHCKVKCLITCPLLY